MNAITRANVADSFRGKATGLMNQASNMTLHELVDDFQRLSAVMEANISEDEMGRMIANDIAKMAGREQKMVNAAAAMRFGLTFRAYDRMTDYGDYEIPF